MRALLERVAVVGPTGQLGNDLMRVFSDCAPIPLPHQTFDLEQPLAMSAALRRTRPTVVINTAAFHNVDLCEARPDRAFAVNALGVDALAALCGLAGIPIVHVSTDYVFPGTREQPYAEDDTPAPINAYGISKLAGEQLIARHDVPAFIIRTSGLYGRAGSSTKGYTFIDRLLTQARAGRDPVRVVTDVTFSPSYSLDVARGMRRILESGVPGIYHVTNAGHCTWYEFAREAFDQAGIEAPIERTTQAAFGSAARRPMYSALAHAGIERLGLPPMPHWREGLRAYLAERGEAS